MTLAWLSGCGPLVSLESSTETEAGEGGTTTGTPPPPQGTTLPPQPGTTLPPSVTSGDGTDEGESDSEPMTSLVFLDGNDDFPGNGECGFFEQDCPEGQKCMPWANDGGNSWNALRCSPIAEDPDGVGEPCTVEGSGVSGIDSCGAGSMCWDVDPVTLAGECIAFCMGDESNPLCEDELSSCMIGGDSVLALCFPVCNPLAQDCDEGDACYPVNDTFTCLIDSSGELGAPGDPCEFINVCDPGGVCLSPDYVPGCEEGASGCCSPFCDVTVEPSACLPGQECVPWWDDPADASPGLENVGVCGLPM